MSEVTNAYEQSHTLRPHSAGRTVLDRITAICDTVNIAFSTSYTINNIENTNYHQFVYEYHPHLYIRYAISYLPSWRARRYNHHFAPPYRSIQHSKTPSPLSPPTYLLYLPSLNRPLPTPYLPALPPSAPSYHLFHPPTIIGSRIYSILNPPFFSPFFCRWYPIDRLRFDIVGCIFCDVVGVCGVVAGLGRGIRNGEEGEGGEEVGKEKGL